MLVPLIYYTFGLTSLSGTASGVVWCGRRRRHRGCCGRGGEDSFRWESRERQGRQDMLWHWVELVGWLGR